MIDLAQLRPELRRAFEASWAENEAAYRYLGRPAAEDRPCEPSASSATPPRSSIPG